MPAKKSTRIKTDAVTPCADQREAEAYLLRIGHAQRERQRIETALNDALAEIKAKFALQAEPLSAEIAAKFQALHLWAEAHRDTLLKKGAKTAKLATGTVSWRTTPPAVSLRDQAKILEMLKKLGLTEAVRIKEEVNKDAIKAEPQKFAGIKGVSITQREEFAAVPFESQLEVAETVTAADKKRRAA